MVMRQMRENTKWIMLVTALAFVALMVFEWGMDFSGQTSQQLSGGEIGRVNGTPISQQEYAEVYRALYQQQASGGQSISPSLMDQIEEAAWEQLVMQRLISQELKRRGIEVTGDEIRQAARYAPPPEFQTNELFRNAEGQFDLSLYHAFLSSPRVDTELLVQLENYYRDAIPRSKLYYQATAGTYATDGELWRMWRDTHERVRMRYVVFDPTVLVPEAGITVTDAEIRDYYRANQSNFLRPAQATVKYVVIDRSPLAADTAAARQRAANLSTEIAGGADFDAVARREAENAGTPAPATGMTLTRGQTYPALDQAVFAARPGTVIEPVLTPPGYIVARVNTRSGDTAQVNQMVVPVALSAEREDELFTQADSLEALTERLKLDEAAGHFGMEARTAELIPGLSFIPGLGLAEDGLAWTFEEAQPGEVSEVFETPNAYYVFELVQKQEERTLSLEEATPTVRTALIAAKRLERAKETARQALDRLNAGASMEQVAQQFNGAVQETDLFSRADFVPGIGRLNPAIGTAFGLKTGELSGVVESDRKLYIIRLVERQDAARAEWEAQKAEQRQRVTQALAEQRWNQFLSALREQAEVVDGRAQLNQRVAAQGLGF